MIKNGVWCLAALLALIAGYTDWRWRRIPNWLTVPGLILGVVSNSLAWGWSGARNSLLGAALGLALLLPLVLVRSLGAGDWKLVGAIGAFVGWRSLLTVLAAAVIVNGLIVLGMIIQKRRIGRTLRNMFRLLASFLSLHLPENDLTLDNPDAVKVPFGVSAAIAVVLFSAEQIWRQR